MAPARQFYWHAEIRTFSGRIWARIWARAGYEALQFLRDLAPADPKQRAVVLRAAHYRLSTLIAMRQAELLMAAEGASHYGAAPRGVQFGRSRQPARAASAAAIDLASQASA